MRCCAHILNLVVKYGLSIISSAIERVRDNVSFWTATPKREEKFEETCERLNIQYDKKLELDCKTKWNFTFLMLHVALIENLYKTLPNEDDWEMSNEICQKLKLFYNVTLVFSGTFYPTVNVFFPKICEIKLALRDYLVIHQMLKLFLIQSQTLNLVDVGANGVNVHWRAQYQSFVSEQNFATTNCRSLLDIYLEDEVLPDQGGELLPDTIETLICLQDWLRGSSNSKLDIIGCGTILEDFDVNNDPTSQCIVIERNDLEPKLATLLEPKLATSLEPKLATLLEPKFATLLEPKFATLLEPKFAT
ncbi:hypothetical protein Lal_00022743 [Lupinus albus]|nr:hypothetical protein Lal_00022743 [Lupinus albus]